MYGVTLPSNTIVAAGSVVVKSPEKEGCIIGGNPAKVIGLSKDFLSRNDNNSFSLHGLSLNDRKKRIMLESDKLVAK